MSDVQRGDDPVARFLSLIEPATGPPDHIDDDTLTLIATRTASQRDLAAVRAHLIVCPPCRRIVGDVQRHAAVPRAFAADHSAWKRGARTPGPWALAACLLLGVSALVWSTHGPRQAGVVTTQRNREGPATAVDRGQDSHATAQVLLAAVQLVPNASRGRPVSRNRSPRGKTPLADSPPAAYHIDIKAPHDGTAVVVRVWPDHWEPLRGEVRVLAEKPASYGPIEASEASVAYIVIVADLLEPRELPRLVRGSVPSGQRGIEALERWRADVIARLTAAGHRWLSIEFIKGPTAGRRDPDNPAGNRVEPSETRGAAPAR